MLNCRKCPIRNRCIEEGVRASSIKMMLYHAFENRTDTLGTWGRLQANCLIAKYKREEDDKLALTDGPGALSKRLQRVQDSKKRKSALDSTGKIARSNGFVGYEEINQRIDSSEIRSLQKHFTTFLKPFAEDEIADTNMFWLTVEGSWRHIALPTDGTLVLGHFNPSVGLPPDVDLGFEDKKHQRLSRRHAAIVGKNGQHTLEDMGSVAGTFLNDDRLGLRPSRPLQPGDSITMGGIKLRYDHMPPIVQNAGTSDLSRHILMLGSTGRKFRLEPGKPVIIGRGDAAIGYMPDIDLLPFGAIAQRVSRRHASIEWRNGIPHVEDMGSGFGTRLRGGLLPLGEQKPLMPGDHIWLAGCVLVYDIQVKELAVSKAALPREAMQPPQMEYRVSA
jgi:pSer/pThr/pTyr-binding forkhead associated (FHA) protein